MDYSDKTTVEIIDHLKSGSHLVDQRLSDLMLASAERLEVLQATIETMREKTRKEIPGEQA